MFLQLCANRRWKVKKGDVVGAFLQNDTETEKARQIYTEAVPEIKAAMNMKEDEVCQILKAGYGLTSAPRRWWEQVCRDLEKLGTSASRIEACL